MPYQVMIPYVPVTGFSDDEAQGTGGRSTVNTSGLDAELAALQTITDQFRNNLELMQRSDGFIQDKFIHPASLANETLALMGDINPVGTWLTATAYKVKDVVVNATITYLAAEDHTSGVFLTDLAAGKWLRLTGKDDLDVSAKGDLQGHDGTTSVRIPVGSDGNFLKADSGASEGVSWSAPSAPTDFIISVVQDAEVDLVVYDGLVPSRNITITQISLFAGIAPTGADMTLQLTRDGSEVAGTLATLTAGSSHEKTNITDAPFTTSERLGLKFKQAGSTDPGSEVIVTLHLL